MAPTGRPVNLASWDGTFYASIAEFGYSGAHDHAQNGTMGSLDNTLAFFPGYPWLVKLAAPLTGGHYLAAAVVVSLAGGVAFAYGVRALALRLTGSSRAALIAVVLTAAMPMSVTFVLAYPEAVFC